MRLLVFTGENMDIRDVDTMYFYIFPGKKQYVKRLMGKPGDLLYFYGGEIYGIDGDGKDITSELQIEQLDKSTISLSSTLTAKLSSRPVLQIYFFACRHLSNERTCSPTLCQ